MSFSHSPRIVTNGLVLALDAADQNSYPGSGTTWSDMSGNGNNGILQTGTSYNASNSGNISFNGTSGYISTTTNLGANPYPSLTYSVWFRTTVGGYKIIGIENSQTGIASNAHDRHIYIGSDSKLYYGVYDTANRLITSTITVTDNTWKNVTTVTTGANSISMYINGVLNVTGTGNGYSAYTTSYIRLGSYGLGGTWTNGSNGYFTGNISNVQVYNRALLASEILQNYNAQKSRFGLS